MDNLKLDSNDIEIQPPPSPWDGWIDVYLEWSDGVLEGDHDFYRQLALEHRGFVVELGCGDGRMFSEVQPDLGLDTSAAMLQRAAEHPAGVEVRYGDLVSYNLTKPATFSFAAFNVMSHLPSQQAQQKALANVRANTVPGGVFAFDAMSATVEEVKRRNGLMMLSHRTSEWVVQTATRSVGPDTEMMWHGLVDYLDETGFVVKRRYMPEVSTIPRPPAEWVELATETGWKVLGHYSGFDADEPPKDSGWQVLVLQNT